MARMYSRKRGKAGSKKPIKKTIPSWVRYKPKEAEMLIAKLAKEGNTSSQIGSILRDSYGVPDIRPICKKKITRIMEEKGIKKEIPEDLLALIKRAVLIRKHLEENKKDQVAHRGLTLTESKVKRLVKYYKKTGKIASEWKYEPERAEFFME
ncbi:30S ribosomal protein S15 [Candidatus Woesearchaeota archaeon]|nr:30S ribosomal protein S15 [Candidatus Woesearchaeota archaeon]